MWFPTIALTLVSVGTICYLYSNGQLSQSPWIRAMALKSLDSWVSLKLGYRYYFPVSPDQLRILGIHLIDDQLQISPTTNLNLENENSTVRHIHVIYEFRGKVYRLILSAQHLVSHDSLQHYLDHQVKDKVIASGPATSPESWTLTNSQFPLIIPAIAPDELAILVHQYAGPLGDFYEFLDYRLPGDGLLQLDNRQPLLRENDQLVVEDVLGQEWTFEK